MYQHWNRNFAILMKFSSQAVPEVVILTISSVAIYDIFVKMTTFHLNEDTHLYKIIVIIITWSRAAELNHIVYDYS